MSYVNQSVKEEEINESFVTLKAPRTVIGAHGNGSLFLIQVHKHQLVGVVNDVLSWVLLGGRYRRPKGRT